MTSFDDREKGHESKYAHDQQTQFKINARRNKLLGQWAADKLGHTGEAAEAYTKEVIASDFEEAGDDDVLRKVFGDFQAAGIEITEVDVRREMNQLLEVAREQVTSGN